ncbi:MAG: hypothetical protein KUG77_24330 [Nannocystaceae bacterium]|nr:hypothetical protein [Nannocystaceae bacterium]
MIQLRDHIERFAQRLWRRWLRAARYALETTPMDAMLRYRFADHKEVRNAVRDVLEGREGLVYMLHRARRAARNRLRPEIENLAIRLAFSMPAGGRGTLARAAARAGYAVSPSTIRRMLLRRGLWGRAS